MLLVQILSRLRESDGSAPTLIDLLEHLFNRRLIGDAPQFTGQVLLKRLAATFSATPKRRVHILGEVTNEHVHAYKMLSRS